jgi:NADP-dependent 3-hydroxy acid dehydrogenase YdfG
MSAPLDGVVAAVTGASSGIGEATARALAAGGATVAMLARRTERLRPSPTSWAGRVNVSSDAGRRVLPVGAVYSATKHAVGAFSESLRQELAGAHVRVGVVEPGITRTELPEKGASDSLDLDALGDQGVLEAADIADAVVYMVTRPARVAVNEILVRPVEQA